MVMNLNRAALGAYLWVLATQIPSVNVHLQEVTEVVRGQVIMLM